MDHNGCLQMKKKGLFPIEMVSSQLSGGAHDEIYRYNRQPSRLSSAPSEQAQVLSLSTVWDEGQTEARDDTTHCAHCGPPSPFLDCRRSWRVSGPLCMLHVLPGVHCRRAVSGALCLGSA